MRTTRPLNLLLLVATVWILSACTSTGTTVSTTTPIEATGAQPTASTVPSATPTKTPNTVALLVDDAAGFPSPAVRSALDALAAESGYQLLAVPSGSPAELPVTTQIIVGALDPAAIPPFQQQAPDARFVLIGPAADAPADRITMLPMGDSLEQELAFAAGYTAALLTEDYRVGLLLPSGQSDISTAFANGYQYFCGLCRPVYPPYVSYPASAELGPDGLDTAAQSLADRAVQTAYVVGSALTADSVNALADRGIRVLGRSRPDGTEGAEWMASIRLAPERALETLWPQLMAGENPSGVRVPIVIEERDSTAFGQGKLRLVEEVIASLRAGWIDTGIAPP
ncbi:MAG: hypothetical protein WBR18_09810 [Anaerolineales bacterium]